MFRLRRAAAAAVALALLALVWATFQPLAGDGGDPVAVVIPREASADDIGGILDRAGVVPSSALFELRAGLAGERGNLKAGRYRLPEDMAYGAVIDRLVAGPASDVIRLTIPEGLSRKEIAPRARAAGVRGDYEQASTDVSAIRPRRFGIDGQPNSLEGFLFPATYELAPRAAAQALVAKQLAAFQQNFARVDLSHARSKNLTAYDVLTIASMVEREAQIERERPLIAAVIYNRLREGQPLGIDATIRYVTGNWRSPLTRGQLAIDSPYNTRTRTGLPPGPIGNPGLASIRAAARPSRVGYLYYVVKPETCGEHAFSSTFDQFERDRQRYQQARAAAGGAPTSCP